MSNPRSISKRRKWEVMARDGFRCRYCGVSATHGARLVVDHIHSVVQGGDREDDNLVTACFGCNVGKKERSLLGAPPPGAGLYAIKERVPKRLPGFQKFIEALADGATKRASESGELVEASLIESVKRYGWAGMMAMMDATAEAWPQEKRDAIQDDLEHEIAWCIQDRWADAAILAGERR